MLAADAMRTSFATIKPNARVLDAVRLLLETDQRGLPVVNDGGELVGMVSEGDFLHRDELGVSPPSGNWLESLLGIDENNPERARMHAWKVGAIMSPVPITASVHASLDEIVAQMDIYNIAQVPVVSAGAVIGIVSRRELLAVLASRLSEKAANESTGAHS
jgi:CBS domain-containing protein